jgi:hydrogenase/urease accessory protein HupE
MQKKFAKVAFSFILTFIAPFLYAHQVGVSRGNYAVSDHVVKVELIFARPEILASLPAMTKEEISTRIVNNLVVSSGNNNCAGELQDVVPKEGDGLLIRANYQCEKEANVISFRLSFLNTFARVHRHIVSAVSGETKLETIAFQSNSEFQLSSNSINRSTFEVFGSLFYFGVEHILIGYDHLLFLFGLILIGGSIRQMMIVVSSFTIAHSITIGLSALGVWAPSSTFVEPAIALSIAYIGAENWFIKNAGRRWLITFPFGLIHGFGFAGALSEISLPAGQVPVALAAFNLGVEAGQLAFLLIAMPVVLWLRKREWFAVQGVKGLSTAIALAGMWLLVTRLG